MRWVVIEDLGEFLGVAGTFLHSRPVLHTVPLTVTETLRVRGPQAYGAEAPVFGVLEGGGAVRGAWFRTPPYRLTLTPLAVAEAEEGAMLEALAEQLAGLGHALPGMSAEQATAGAFAEAWQRRTGAKAELRQRQQLYRLGELTPPSPMPQGRARVAGARDRELLVRWHEEFAEAVGNVAAGDAESWADARIRSGGVVLWETPDGAPVSMAGTHPMVAGQVRVAPVYTPAGFRGQGYAGAATVAASRGALAAGAEDVLLFTDLANSTSNGLYRRVGYRGVAEFEVYDFLG
ncbi:putative GNAT family acetyltransferase [Streptomyces canus]|uniref:GNAT family N-acetyltransferase n=1 Tax=Streptomyces canus TaxID=58343 RepID=UPI00277FB1A3|nr:GNAT family N-acetyltransferase [Streptomyces canus]MDQ0600989.1 putative GNAT family acetyltransferase [Streptomyces canus]